MDTATMVSKISLDGVRSTDTAELWNMEADLKVASLLISIAEGCSLADDEGRALAADGLTDEHDTRGWVLTQKGARVVARMMGALHG